jgi:hypothetical protein
MHQFSKFFLHFITQKEGPLSILPLLQEDSDDEDDSDQEEEEENLDEDQENPNQDRQNRRKGKVWSSFAS